MKSVVLVASFAALVCVALAIWLEYTTIHPIFGFIFVVLAVVVAGLALALAAGVQSAVYASRLGHPGWSRLLAIVTALAVVASCTGLAASLGFVSFAVQLNQALAASVAPVTILALLAMMAVFLLRPRGVSAA